MSSSRNPQTKVYCLKLSPSQCDPKRKRRTGKVVRSLLWCFIKEALAFMFEVLKKQTESKGTSSLFRMFVKFPLNTCFDVLLN